MNIEALEQELDSFQTEERRAALTALAGANQGSQAQGDNVNMHCHSFFSFNARGFSPSRIAWEARREGWYAAGLCDFDVLDGLEEFLAAGRLLGLRVTVNLETRAYLREYADVEICSPGEPGVTYIMGAGFIRPPPAGSPAAQTLARYREQAGQRNQALVARINRHLGAMAIDYARDVIPLSPGGCPTERHIIRAYLRQAENAFARQSERVAFWSELLKQPAPEIEKLLVNFPAFEEKIRGRLVKKGGLGYAQPSPTTFPPVDDFIAWVRACEAIPMMTWLDGASKGEEKTLELLKCFRAKGAAAVNIIPDRNWNFADPAQRALKTAKLQEFVATAAALDLPINIGTEMNKDGLPLVDDLAAPALRPHRQAFLRGAQVMVGHSILAQYAAFPYGGDAAQAEFPNNPAAKNRFFEAVGALPPLTAAVADRLATVGPRKALEAIRNSAQKNQWVI
jgi:hypothetical protein